VEDKREITGGGDLFAIASFLEGGRGWEGQRKGKGQIMSSEVWLEVGNV